MSDALTLASPPATAPLTRRDFLRAAGALAGAAAVLAAGVGQQVSPPPALVRATFAGLLGDDFAVRVPGAAPLALQLTRVRDLAATAAGKALAGPGSRTSFSILFRGPIGRPLSQDTYDFDHARLGPFPLFIVPLVPAPDAVYYEAIFNTLPS